jgi:tetratricopeptide (TPR) repeat protein
MTSEPVPTRAQSNPTAPAVTAAAAKADPDKTVPDKTVPDKTVLDKTVPDNAEPAGLEELPLEELADDPVTKALSKLNNAEKKVHAKRSLELGQATFERGRYPKAIEHFQQALALSNPISGLGGEIQLWLVNAYIAAGDNERGLSLCRKLIRHPDLETQRQSKRLLYILEAPELEMKPEWVTKIPDLSNLGDDNVRRYPQTPKRSRKPKPKAEKEPIDLSQVNTADNQFVWVALGAIALALGGLIWFS